MGTGEDRQLSLHQHRERPQRGHAAPQKARRTEKYKKIYPLLNQIPFVKNSKSQFDTFDIVGSRSGDARSLAALRGDLCHRTRSGQQWTWSESRNRNQNQQPDGQMETSQGVSCSPKD